MNDVKKASKKGILLSNLGSPDAPTTAALRTYLDEFLMDPYVIDVPFVFRAILVRGIVLRNRPKQSAHAYKAIWTEHGSPLVCYTRAIAEKVQKILGDDYCVKFAMRYGKPNFTTVLDEFLSEGIEEVSLMPLYPQWALASTGSTMAHLKELDHKCKIAQVLKPFHSNKDFVELIATRVRSQKIPQDNLKTHYLFSFHGIPERHIKKTPGCAECKIDDQCCLQEDAPALCYRSHCTKTAHAVARNLELDPDSYSISFQSRLGPDQWLTPFTDKVLKILPEDGIERLVILSPAFTADCLETLEELGIRGRDDFLQAGGKEYVLVPSLNDGDDWAEALASWVTHSEMFERLR